MYKENAQLIYLHYGTPNFKSKGGFQGNANYKRGEDIEENSFFKAEF